MPFIFLKDTKNILETLQCEGSAKDSYRVTLAQRPGSAVSHAFLMALIWSTLSVSFFTKMFSALLLSLTTRSVQLGLVRSRLCTKAHRGKHTRTLKDTEGHSITVHVTLSMSFPDSQVYRQTVSQPARFFTCCNNTSVLVHLFRDHHVLYLH